MSPAEPEFSRTTRRAEVGEMPAEFSAALAERAALIGYAGDPLGPARAVAVTDSVPRRRGFLRRNREHVHWMVVSGDVLAVVSDASGRPVASLYRLDSLEASPYRGELIADSGLEVVAMPVGGTERASLFLPLAEGSARDELAAALGA